MSVALNALLPVLLIIVVGWAAANIPIVPREQWAGLDTLMYYILFPSLLIVSLTATDLTALPFTTLGLALILSILTMAALCLLLRPVLASRFGVDGPGFTSIFQGATRWNTTVAIAHRRLPLRRRGRGADVGRHRGDDPAPERALRQRALLVRRGDDALAAADRRRACEEPADPRLRRRHRAQPRRHRPPRRRHVGAAAPRQCRACLRRACRRCGARPALAPPPRSAARARRSASPSPDAAPRRGLLRPPRRHRNGARHRHPRRGGSDRQRFLYPRPQDGRRREADGGDRDAADAARCVTLPFFLWLLA